ncbi:MAG: ABC transporter permease [Nitrosomonadaceae bacterium]|nr:ABC transporter permease [Nitrosomonadaceae bacterium]|tara:strand:+ start:707 stop:1597 length:891 start_codon:yes stop_codon:yes gene_type:complete
MSTWLSYHWHAFFLSLRRLFEAPFTSLLNIIVIGIAFSFPTGMYMLLDNIQNLSGQLSGAPQLSIFLKSDTNKAAIERLKSHLKQHPEIANFQFISKEDALKQLEKEGGLADVLNSLTRNPLPDAFIIDAKDTSPETLKRLRAEMLDWPNSEHVQLDSTWMEKLNALIKLGALVVLILTILLSSALIIITFNTIRLQILTKRDEIEVSKLIGATSNFIRRPFLYFGAIQSMAGGAIAWLIVAIIITLINDELLNMIQIYTINFQLTHISYEDSIFLLLFSFWLGWLGSWLSVTSHL